MCYSTAHDYSKKEVAEYFNRPYNIEEYEPQYYASAFPRKSEAHIHFASLPVLTVPENDIEDEIRDFNWGFVPPYLNDPLKVYEFLKKYPTYNAKGEEMGTKKSYAPALKARRRCLIPVTGFYEHRHHSKALKIPYIISRKDTKIFSLAGLYNYWKTEDGEKVGTFTIITTKANPMMEYIHNSKKRMPLILSKDDETTWLDPDTPDNLIDQLVKPFSESEMEAHTIARKPYNQPMVAEKVKYEEVSIFE